jgi:F-type H+-transporting ATPase subunit epsilon
MARTKFPVEVLTPEGEVFSDEIEMISTRTSVGSIGILAGHEPVLAMLEPTELRLYRSESDVVRFAQAEGYMQFADNHALVLVEEALAPEAVDRERLQQRLAESRANAEAAQDGSEEKARAQRDIRRYDPSAARGRPGTGRRDRSVLHPIAFADP